jgi:hypothetical protein
MNRKNIGTSKMLSDYQSVLESESEVYTAQDINDRGAKKYRGMTMEEFIYQIENQDANLYEIIHQHKPMCFYLDLDGKAENGENYPVEEVLNNLTDTLDEFILDNELPQHMSDDGNCFIWQVLDASTESKTSLHIKVESLQLEKFDDLDAFAKLFKKWINEQYNDKNSQRRKELHSIIDFSVYNRNRLFRAFGQSKYGENRPLNPLLASSMSAKDHLITYTQEKYGFVKIHNFWRPKNKPTENKYAINGDLDYYDDEELQKLVENTTHKGEEYGDWIKWVWAMEACGVPHHEIHRLSEEAEPSKYDWTHTEKVINDYNPYKCPMTRGTLKSWAREVGYEPERLRSVEAPLLEVGEVIPIFVDIQQRFHDKLFDSWDELIEALNKDVVKSVRYIQGKDMFCYNLDKDEPNMLAKELPTCLIKYTAKKGHPTLKEEGKTFRRRLSDYMRDSPLHFPIYNKLVFKPAGKGLCKHEYNLWCGFKAREVDTIDMGKVQPILNHILEVLADNNETYYKYIISWLAQIIQKPWRKTETALLFKGQEGDGKSCIAEFIRTRVIGWEMSLVSCGLEKITQRFNSCVMNKLFVELSELAVAGDDYNKSFDNMKVLITDPMITVEQKGIEPFPIQSHSNFFATTNHDFTVRMSESDRRWACFETSSKYRGNWEYFDKLHELIRNEDDSISDEVGNHFYTYLLKYEDRVNLRSIPMTPLKQSMIETSMNSVALFIKELPYAGFDEGVLVKVGGVWVCKNSELYAQYLAWCITNHQKSFKDNVFHKNIPKHMVIKKGRGREPFQFRSKTEYNRFNYTQIDFNFEIDDNGKFILDNVEIDDVDKED